MVSFLLRERSFPPSRFAVGGPGGRRRNRTCGGSARFRSAGVSAVHSARNERIYPFSHGALSHRLRGRLEGRKQLSSGGRGRDRTGRRRLWQSTGAPAPPTKTGSKSRCPVLAPAGARRSDQARRTPLVPRRSSPLAQGCQGVCVVEVPVRSCSLHPESRGAARIARGPPLTRAEPLLTRCGLYNTVACRSDSRKEKKGRARLAARPRGAIPAPR